VSNDREKLQRKASFSVLASNAMHQQTALARAGNHRFAQAYAKGMNRMMRGAAVD